MSNKKIAIIIGAGPAGLTAAFELLKRTDIKPIIYEMSGDIGGLSKTINYKGNRIDIGGHRFFSKSDKIMQWWLNILPLQGVSLAKNIDNINPETSNREMLLRNRISRIFFMKKFFDYPIVLNFNTFINIGLIRICKIAFSYIISKFFPIKKENSLEDFFINKFGKELYLAFFKGYTEKVWGISCDKINSEWGAQRIKNLSVWKAIFHAIKRIVSKDTSIEQKNTETSLIEQFMYPKFGPGQMWEEVAKIIKDKGGEIFLNSNIIGIKHKNYKVLECKVKDETIGEIRSKKGDYFFSTIPVKELIQFFGKNIPNEVQYAAQGLMYRDFITVGLLLKKLKIKNKTKIDNIIPDNWIYIQEKGVKLGRLQIFNNWSPYMVKDQNTVWIGLEYFCNEGDELWSKSDLEFSNFAINELSQIEIIEKEDVIDSVVIHMPKAYPAYFGTYGKFHLIRNFSNKFENLFLIGRNGMHRYNNQDHSMLTAIIAVENIVKGIRSKKNIWDVNLEKEYHEGK